jgi:hypothetical protein
MIVTGHHRAMHGSRTTVRRQDRPVDVDHPEPRHRQDGFRQDSTVCGNDAEIRGEGRELFQKSRILHPLRLEDGNAPLECDGFRRCDLDAVAAPFGTIRLGDQRDNRMRGVDESREARHRELRRPEIRDPEWLAAHHRPSRCSF